MRWHRAIVGLLIGLAFGLAYFFFAFAAAGAGHGTFIFFAALSPYGLGVIAFPALGFLAGDLRPFLSKVIFISLLVIHYTLVIFTLRIPWIRDAAYIDKTWDFSFSDIVVPAALYIAGNVLLWAVFVYNLIHYRQTPPYKSLDASRDSVFLKKPL
ncbi:MAG TPA: hypothetical protein VGN86_11310 [Pyrinomonadaceae bacterium]|nr:hypothetical protein [Pyrinomonadaceae bacterium]